MEKTDLIRKLQDVACSLRYDVIEMIWQAGTGHPGGSLSLAEIMSVLYFQHMNIEPLNPRWDDRDRFILSKGHAAPVLYSCLSRRGFFPHENIWTLRKLGSILQGHPDMRKTPGVDITSGCLGEGLSAGIGMALGGMLNGKDFWTYVVIGDGELQEGQIWEAAMFAAAKRIPRLTVILDSNGCMCDDFIHTIMPVEPLKEKWEAFGWNFREIDGHNIGQILDVLEEIKVKGLSPTLVKANTCKGKGVAFMENNPDWHGRIMTKDEYAKAIAELEGRGS